MIFQRSWIFVHLCEGTQIQPRAINPKTKHSPRHLLASKNPGLQQHAGAIRERGILVLRLEGPLFYANAGKPRSSQSEATHLMSWSCDCMAIEHIEHERCLENDRERPGSWFASIFSRLETWLPCHWRIEKNECDTAWSFAWQSEANQVQVQVSIVCKLHPNNGYSGGAFAGMDWRRGSFDDFSSLPCKAAYMIARKTWLDFWCKITSGAGIARYWRTDWHCSFSHLAAGWYVSNSWNLWIHERNLFLLIIRYHQIWYFLVYESITWYRDRNHAPSFHIISAEILYQKSRWMEASAIPFMDTTAVQTLKALSKTYLGSNQVSGLTPGFIPTGWSSQVSISKGCIIRYMEVILGDASCNSLSLFKIVYPCRPCHIIDFSYTCSQKYVSLMQLASAEAILGGPRCDFVTLRCADRGVLFCIANTFGQTGRVLAAMELGIAGSHV